MIKEEKTTKEVIIKHKYCDDCGKEIPRGLACGVARCELCGADLCDKCVAYEESTSGDYREVYCTDCYSIAKEYKPQIEELDDEINKIYDAMRSICKEVRLNKSKNQVK